MHIEFAIDGKQRGIKRKREKEKERDRETGRGEVECGKRERKKRRQGGGKRTGRFAASHAKRMRNLRTVGEVG